MGYLAYYLFFFVISYTLRYPWLLAAVVVVWLSRRWLPDPYLYFKHAGHVRRLKAEIAHNAENATARRDLAKIWLAKKRPRRAIVLLEEARRRDRDSAELPLLLGTALYGAGRADEALPLLVEAAGKNERQMYGEAYLVAGKALRALGRFAEAEDAFARYLAINSSSVEGRVLLACVRRELKDAAGAKAATREALETFAAVPRFRRRAELKWYVRARLMTLGLA
ncbi:MAG TPA: tetratricopeptide repeat protein [Polyangia bacterium]|nr:tetratricopeptide repeat protein [Polyangia bacterium]